VLSGCSFAPSPADEQSARPLALPVLTVERQRIQPAEMIYRSGTTTRRHSSARTAPAAVPVTPRRDLRMRLVGRYPVRVLRVGAFARVDAHDAPVDGGDQYDCLADSPCRAHVRAGSLVLRVPLLSPVRLVIVREVCDLEGGGTLEVVWRFLRGEATAGS
jgi:hypothetical protein